MDSIVHGVAKVENGLSDFHLHFLYLLSHQGCPGKLIQQPILILPTTSTGLFATGRWLLFSRHIFILLALPYLELRRHRPQCLSRFIYNVLYSLLKYSPLYVPLNTSFLLLPTAIEISVARNLMSLNSTLFYVGAGCILLAGEVSTEKQPIKCVKSLDQKKSQIILRIQNDRKILLFIITLQYQEQPQNECWYI